MFFNIGNINFLREYLHNINIKQALMHEKVLSEKTELDIKKKKNAFCDANVSCWYRTRFTRLVKGSGEEICDEFLASRWHPNDVPSDSGVDAWRRGSLAAQSTRPVDSKIYVPSRSQAAIRRSALKLSGIAKLCSRSPKRVKFTKERRSRPLQEQKFYL